MNVSRTAAEISARLVVTYRLTERIINRPIKQNWLLKGEIYCQEDRKGQIVCLHFLAIFFTKYNYYLERKNVKIYFKYILFHTDEKMEHFFFIKMQSKKNKQNDKAK